jgi:ATP-dependent DNA helicase RecQ
MQRAKDFEQILRENFGLSEFRGEQRKIIERVMAGADSLVLMPTGMGKSLCYQLPALCLPGLTLVVSPLIALMEDQVSKAQKVGISATFLASTLSSEERAKRLNDVLQKKFKLLYVTPERLQKPEFLSAIAALEISCLAVDEAHCISLWGHDFRPDYAKIGRFREIIGSPPTLALTATATTQVQKDIVESLALRDHQLFAAGVARENLQLFVHEVVGDDEKIRGLMGLRHQAPGPAIIYFSLIRTLEKFSYELTRLGVSHCVYHGQMKGDQRTKNQRNFIEGRSDLILATPAFGLGVDKKDVRLLVHIEIPASIEAYYQEYGRAGRDGEPSQCHLFLDQDDVSIQMDFLKWGNPEPSFIRRIYEMIEGSSIRLKSEGVEYLRDQMNFYNRRDYRVEAALNILERWECLVKDRSKLGFAPQRPPSNEELDLASYEIRIKAQNSKLLQMLQLAQMTQGCRPQSVYSYFGYQTGPCGRCDLCQKLGVKI